MNLRYILIRTIAFLIVIVVALYGLSFVKKKQRLLSITSELKSLSSESSFFRQFSADDAQKSLVRAIGLIAEAKKLGLDPETSINRGLGIEEKYFNSDDDEEITLREQLIHSTLRSNYENFRKLGYTADFHTLESLKNGELPQVRTGSLQGNKAEVGTIISAALSPGLDTVLANLEIRPVRVEELPMTDVEAAIAMNLAKQFRDADIIEENAYRRIMAKLSDLKKVSQME